MLVKTLRRHENQLGDKFVKNPGKIYDAGDQAAMLIDQGLVERAPAKAAPVQDDE